MSEQDAFIEAMSETGDLGTFPELEHYTREYVPVAQYEEAVARAKQEAPVGMLMPSWDNPRTKASEITGLAESIASVGLLEPILVLPEDGKYRIVSGHRRWDAAKLADLETVPIRVLTLPEADRVLAMLIANIQREDLTPLEEAKAYKQLIRARHLTQRQLAPLVGRSQSHIAKRLALLNRADEARRRARRAQRAAAARSALRAQNRLKAAKKAGGDLGEGYTLIRRALDVLERASSTASPEQRRAIRSAMHALYSAEDRVSEAVRLDLDQTKRNPVRLGGGAGPVNQRTGTR